MVIGAGAVGATTAFTLVLRSRSSEVVLIDLQKDLARAQALDMSHGSPFLGGTRVRAGDYADCAAADIIILTAGAAQRPGETRQDLLGRNVKIMDSVLENISQYNTDAILLVAANPVDVLSYYIWKKSGRPWQRVIGSGTLLDTARFRYLMGQHLEVDPRSIHGHIVGEHGDSEIPVWSRTNVAGVPVHLDAQEKDDIFTHTRDAAYQIIAAKGSTSYAIALVLDRICAAILHSESSVLNVSTLLSNYHGIDDVYLSVPCVIDRDGVRQVLDLQPTTEEIVLLRNSAELMKERIRTLPGLS